MKLRTLTVVTLALAATAQIATANFARPREITIERPAYAYDAEGRGLGIVDMGNTEVVKAIQLAQYFGQQPVGTPERFPPCAPPACWRSGPTGPGYVAPGFIPPRAVIIVPVPVLVIPNYEERRGVYTNRCRRGLLFWDHPYRFEVGEECSVYDALGRERTGYGSLR